MDIAQDSGCCTNRGSVFSGNLLIQEKNLSVVMLQREKGRMILRQG